ncbi:MAG: glycosyltransferase [Flavobacteriales bacterium]|nr:MAG: glycosyltransferase [Flavobacteriales bacterium]
MKKTIDRLLALFVYSFSAIIFMPPAIKPLLIIGLGLISLMQFVISKKRSINKTLFTLSCIVFVFYCLSLTGSINIADGLKMLETKLSMFFIPLIFSVFLSGKKIREATSVEKFSNLFYYMNTAYSVVLLVYFTQYENPKYPNLYIPGFYQSASREIPFIGEHHTYIGLILATSILLLFSLKKKTDFFKPSFSTLCLAPMGILIWLLQPRAIILGLFIALLMLFWTAIRKNMIVITASIFTAGTIILALTPEKNNRFLEIKNLFNYSQFNSASQRLIILECTVAQIKQNPFVGLGIGTTNRAIGDCFNKKTNDFEWKAINTHNQYLDLWLTCGPYALIFFLFFLFSIRKHMLESGNKRFIPILLLFVLTMFFENILERQTGIMVFYFIIFYLVGGDTKRSHQRVLLIGPLPNPVTGLSIANELALSTLNPTGKPLLSINTSPKRFSEKLGRFNLISLLHFTLNYLEIYKIISVSKVYYTPGQTFFGVLKYAPFVLFSKFLGKEIIVHIHGNYVAKQYEKLDGLQKRIFRKILSYSNKGIVLSKTLHNNLSPFIAKENVFVLPNFYNKQLTEQPVEKAFSELKICYLSNLMNEKGVFFLLEALEELNAKGISFKATIAGHIEQSQQEILLNKMSQIEGLMYKGLVRGEEKSQMLQEANVFVLPTFYRMEGLPISIIEAMATGNVIITTNHGAIPDLITEGENGFLIKKKSADAIVEKLLFLVENPSKAKEISNNNILKAKRSFTSEKFSEKLLNILDA